MITIFREAKWGLAVICRWTGRIIGLLLVGLIMLLAIGEGMPNVFIQPVVVQIGFLALGLILAGILAGWRWEFSGGIASLLGWSLFLLSEIRSSKNLNWLVSTLALPGTLYLASALLRHYKDRPSVSGWAKTLFHPRPKSSDKLPGDSEK